MPSLTCNWCVQVVAEALAKAEELNGPELAARIRSLKDPQAARLQVISHAWLLLITQNSLSILSLLFLQVQYEESKTRYTTARRRVARPHVWMAPKVQSPVLATLLCCKNGFDWSLVTVDC